MAIGIDLEPGVRVVVPRGNLLGEEAEALGRRLGEAIAAGLTRVVVDLRPVHHVTARALGILLSHLGELRRRGGDLKLLGCRPPVLQLLNLCGLGAIFDFLASEDQVPDSFRPRAGDRDLLDAASAGA